MSNEAWTIKKLLDWTTEYFNKNQIENPHLEAEILLARALNAKRIDLYINFEKEPGKEELAKFKGYVQRRRNNEPAAYITGIKSFMSLDFIVTNDVLIPRPETELLVETAMDIAKNIDKPFILDIGTGSGAIAVSLAKYIEKAIITATDTSEKALEVARKNAAIHQVENRITFEHADLFPAKELKFDIIVSNPPYIRTEDIASLQPEIKNFEPISALDGGTDGLNYYRSMIANARCHLKNGGLILLEIGAGQDSEVANMLKNNDFSSVSVKKDLNGMDRVLVAKI